jgi:hypothetical protein
MVTFPYEDLGPDRFQELCQALLIQEYPRLQCLPVRMPDGGRDAVVTERFSDTLVFQVKYRAPAPPSRADYQDYLSWLQDAISDDLAKLGRLIERGLQRYVIISNVPCSPHSDTGTRDKMIKWLSTNISAKIEVDVWWRSDLDRRLENNWDLQRTYGLTSAEFHKDRLLEALLGLEDADIADTVKTSRADPRLITIRQFLRSQYNRESHIRFKQAELPTYPLLKSYLDVRAIFDLEQIPRKREITELRHLIITLDEGDDWNRRRYIGHRSGGYPAAGLLLMSAGSDLFKNVVVEGAPGQGKSTLVQYLCQIHRARLLGELEALNLVVGSYRTSPILLPLKVDLRDLATWLQQRNPFSPNPDEKPQNWIASVEGFLAAMISRAAGGRRFDVDDLDAIIAATPVVLVFDGLDEIAELQERQNVVDHILECIERLEEIGPELRVIVTSRPSAFSTSPRLPHDRFTYFVLADLDESLITTYASNWVEARRVDDVEAQEIVQTLSEKLREPYIAELARNAMQLAILLWLIYQQGRSLPEQHTALYKAYFETFLNREAEKSALIRKHRKLIVGLHAYLAWILHSRAEQGSQGNISEKDLRALLNTYLQIKGYKDAPFIAELFQGMIERVVALVSRVQGTYEFEVQPLREYFAAYYLYHTSRYSPQGQRATGTKSDRFAAIARNPYWHNVTRFYVGFFDIGELAHLLHLFQQLFEDESLGRIMYPRTVAKNLLADHAFADTPLYGQELAQKIAGNPIGWYTLSGMTDGSTLVLAADSGGEEILRLGKQELQNEFPLYMQQIAIALRGLAKNDLLVWWMQRFAAATSDEQRWWLEVAQQSWIFHRMNDEQILRVYETGSRHILDYKYAFSSAFTRIALHSPEFGIELVKFLGLGVPVRGYIGEQPNIIDLAAQLLGDRPPYDLVAARRTTMSLPEIFESAQGIQHLENIYNFVHEASSAIDLAGRRRSHEFGKLSELAVEAFGYSFGAIRAELLNSIRIAPRVDRDKLDRVFALQDSSAPLLARVMSAYSMRDNPAWWSKQCDTATSILDVQIAALLLISFGTERALAACLPSLAPKIDKLPTEHVIAMISLADALEGTGGKLKLSLIGRHLINSWAKLIPLVVTRFRVDQHPKLLHDSLSHIEDPFIRQRVIRHLVDSCYERIARTGRWQGTKRFLHDIAKYSPIGELLPISFVRAGDVREPDHSIIDEVLAAVADYPPSIVKLAEEAATQKMATSTDAIADVAQRDHWWDDDAFSI